MLEWTGHTPLGAVARTSCALRCRRRRSRSRLGSVRFETCVALGRDERRAVARGGRGLRVRSGSRLDVPNRQPRRSHVFGRTGQQRQHGALGRVHPADGFASGALSGRRTRRGQVGKGRPGWLRLVRECRWRRGARLVESDRSRVGRRGARRHVVRRGRLRARCEGFHELAHRLGRGNGQRGGEQGLWYRHLEYGSRLTGRRRRGREHERCWLSHDRRLDGADLWCRT